MLHLFQNIQTIKELSGASVSDFARAIEVEKDKFYNYITTDRHPKKIDKVLVAKVAGLAGVSEIDIYDKKLSIKDIDESLLKLNIRNSIEKGSIGIDYRDKYIQLQEKHIQALDILQEISLTVKAIEGRENSKDAKIYALEQYVRHSEKYSEMDYRARSEVLGKLMGVFLEGKTDMGIYVYYDKKRKSFELKNVNAD